jgi:hypothetical protein
VKRELRIRTRRDSPYSRDRRSLSSRRHHIHRTDRTGNPGSSARILEWLRGGGIDAGHRYRHLPASPERWGLLNLVRFPLPTGNTMESPFATVRLRQRVTKGEGSRQNGLLMAFQLLAMTDRYQGCRFWSTRPDSNWGPFSTNHAEEWLVAHTRCALSRSQLYDVFRKRSA